MQLLIFNYYYEFLIPNKLNDCQLIYRNSITLFWQRPAIDLFINLQPQ